MGILKNGCGMLPRAATGIRRISSEIHFTLNSVSASTMPSRSRHAPVYWRTLALGRLFRQFAAGAIFCLAGLYSDAAAEEFAVGADVSFLAHAEKLGTVFKDRGEAKPGLQILKDHGYNWVRLRLFHTPDRLPNNLEYTIAEAQNVKKLGFKFLLNFHYSDTWADPQKQFIPRAWKGKSHDELVQAVEEYTEQTIRAFREAEAMPDMVQIGNEVIGGMLWPDGRLPNNWQNFADLQKAGIRGVEVASRGTTRPKILMHIDRGGNVASTKFFFDNCQQHGIDFDIIGQSFYPWWHGSLEDLRDNLAFTANRYNKDILLVEVAYNWRPAEYRDEPGPFPETPEGQREFLEAVAQIVRETPNNRGKGVFWWEPAVPPSPISSRGMFDRDGNALPVIGVFDPPLDESPE
jgi:arabinogalactan endo-1,4-beta-galactosidase